MSVTRSIPFPRGPTLPPIDNLGDVAIVRTRPSMSVPRLAQYVVAKPARRRALLRREKYPSPFRTNYAPAKAIFAEALRLGWSEDEVFSIASERWSRLRLDTRLAKRRRQSALDAVVSFALLLEGLRDSLDSLDATVAIAPKFWMPLTEGGVRISGAPSLLLKRGPPEKPEFGVISFYCSMTQPFAGSGLALGALLLHEVAVVNRARSADRVAEDMCLLVDVFSGKIACAPDAGVFALALFVLGCEEIAADWSGA